MSTTAVSAVPEPQNMSIIQRVVNIFVAPTKLFEDLNRNPSWWPAWLLISVFAVLFMFAVDKKVTFEQVVRNEIAASAKQTEQMEKAAPEAREQMLQMRAKGTKVFALYGSPIITLVMTVIFAALMLGTLNFGLGAEIKFSTALAVVFWAGLPRILHPILAIISLLAGADSEGFNLNNPIATNIGFFISRLDHPVAHAFFSFFDIFAFWNIILLGIGFACVSKIKRGATTGVAAAWWFVFALAITGLAAAFA